jgi:ankyrin repeat protein
MFADGDDTELLLKHGASVHVTSTGWTPLTYALTIGHFKAAKVLIQHDVAVNAIDNNGLSTLYYAETISSGVPDRTAIIRVLKQRGARLNQKDKEYLARNRAHAL